MKRFAIAAAAVAWAAVVLPLPAGAGVTVLHGFNYTDGQYPEGRVLVGRDGRIYGTTYSGGDHDLGTVFAVSPAGAFTLLHSFDGSDGDSLYSGLVQRSDGTLFGTTPQGADTVGNVVFPFGGTVFSLQPDGGGFATLHKFTSDGSQPGMLLDGGDGFFYAVDGGANSVVRMASDGTVTTVHAFTSAEGSQPMPTLTLAADGSLYGALYRGANGNANGAIFRISPGGATSILHAFNGADGASPGGTLVDGGDGFFYGVTGGGGPQGAGTVFRMDASGAVTTLHAFYGGDGSSPVQGLAAGPDGNLYGLTFGGGLSNGGTIFRITRQGAFTTLHLLVPVDGVNPVAAPVFGPDGLLYGSTTQYGGNWGTVFSFDALSPQPAALQMSKVCYNEFDMCFPGINTTVGNKYSVLWASANMDSCVASGAWLGHKPTGGQLDVIPLKPGIFTYRLLCKGPSGSKSASVTVTVGR